MENVTTSDDVKLALDNGEIVAFELLDRVITCIRDLQKNQQSQSISYVLQTLYDIAHTQKPIMLGELIQTNIIRQEYGIDLSLSEVCLIIQQTLTVTLPKDTLRELPAFDVILPTQYERHVEVRL